jgi:hypothetical protein
MALASVNIQVVTVIGGKSRITRIKDMDYGPGLMDRDTWGKRSKMMMIMSMEYADGLMDRYIMANTNKARKMVMVFSGFHLAMNTTDSSRMIRGGEKGSRKRMTNYFK